ncbi:hypothetical protein [Streptomyces noursei]|uniref:hypothetical protein n=1 Tax=Streptomyces noursei TaxID=1971 RepID=UPI0023B7BCDF|nr:hypothetical protein [Streptomyces noursei]
MRAGSLTRGGCSVPRAGAVLAVLLTALLHVLGCAHGPTADPALRADAPLFASSAPHRQLPADGPRATTAGRSAPAPDQGPHGCTLDPPTVQPPRDGGPVAWPVVAPLPAGPAGLRPGVPPSALHPSRAPSPASSDGSTRALLGVWRN